MKKRDHVAVIIPCYNEEATIGRVVSDLKQTLPQATIYVYDNNSTDNTASEAKAAGAVVRFEGRKGKGNVVRRAFADVDADAYVMIDGDDTYEAAAASKMVAKLFSEGLDHVLGCRMDNPESTAYRPGHAQGNRLFNRLVSGLFGMPVTDMLSGYRVFSRRFVKSFPALSKEFEIETELTVHTMRLGVPQAEYQVGFKDRPEGSDSKLRTFRDGFKILGTIARLLAHERPFATFGIISLIAAIFSLLIGAPVVWDYIQTGLVPRLPSAVLASGLAVISALSLTVGMTLSGVLRARQEIARLAYLQYEAPADGE